MLPVTMIKIKKFFPYQAVSIRDVFWKSSREEDFLVMESDIKRTILFAHKQWEPVGFTYDIVNIFDNKILFEIESKEGKTFYVSFYDGTVSMGFGIVERDYDPKTHYFKLV